MLLDALYVLTDASDGSVFLNYPPATAGGTERAAASTQSLDFNDRRNDRRFCAGPARRAGQKDNFVFPEHNFEFTYWCKAGIRSTGLYI